ncbi:diguanylate cyclase domain-containing protein [Pannonibacter tanglangensis]|uniref:Diguanylate cyclase n=1 Tax=Pannonibacter tanglangensis TaxID=2750084 RepID=A0ABW9ZPK7_9HYPH|nr:diguanylate cyclase [Pannonibacter sp. XCT-34]
MKRHPFPTDDKSPQAPAAGTAAGRPAETSQNGRVQSLLAALEDQGDIDLKALAELARGIAGCARGFVAILEGAQTIVVNAGAGGTLVLNTSETLCSHVVRQGKPVEYPDLRLEPHLADHPSLAAGLYFYAGFPLRDVDGDIIASLCVQDHAPRPGGLDDGTRAMLSHLGLIASRVLITRNHTTWLRDFLDIASDWVWEHDPVHGITFLPTEVNTPARKAQSEGDAEPLTYEASPELLALLANHDPAQPLRDRRYQTMHRGQMHSISITARARYGRDGSFLGYRGICRDVTVEEESRRQMEYLARHDPLTGLANRIGFKSAVDAAFSEWQDSGDPATLLLLDLDNFKVINDTYGHAAGDELLKVLAGRLQACVSSDATIARLGGDEFAILDPALRSDLGIEDCAATLVRALSDPVHVDGRSVSCGVSIGIALLPRDGGTPDQLLGNADLALYAAKSEGRGRFKQFQLPMRERIDNLDRLKRGVLRARQDGALDIGLREIRSLADNSLIGAHAVAVWNRPDGSRRVLDQLHDELGSSREALDLGCWLLEESAMLARAWQSVARRPLRLRVGLAPAQLAEPGLPMRVRAILARATLAPETLQIDLSAGMLAALTPDMQASLRQMKADGVRIGLTGYGRGATTAAQLLAAGVDRVGLNLTSAGQTVDSDPHRLAQALARLALDLGIAVSADGVTSRAEERTLALAGADEFLLATTAPLKPQAAFLRLLSRQDGGLDAPVATASAM